MRIILFALLVLALATLFTLGMKGQSTGTVIPLPEETQKQLLQLIAPKIQEMYQGMKGCEKAHAVVFVVLNPIHLEVYMECVPKGDVNHEHL